MWRILRAGDMHSEAIKPIIGGTHAGVMMFDDSLFLFKIVLAMSRGGSGTMYRGTSIVQESVEESEHVFVL